MRAQQGVVKTAVKVGGCWYIAPGEPWVTIASMPATTPVVHQKYYKSKTKKIEKKRDPNNASPLG